MAEPWLQLESIAKSYGNVRALRGIDMDFRPGEVHALIGENGCGKSTTVKILAGAVQPDSGQILIDGKEVRFPTPRDALDARISTTYQDSATIDQLTVAENIFLGRERTTAKFLNGAEVSEAKSILHKMEVDLDPRARLDRLTPAERQAVAIAKAVSTDARLLILDEPTAALWGTEVELLFSLVRRLRSSGMSILYISHRLAEVEHLADRITVFRDGAHVKTAPAKTMKTEDMITAMIGRDLGSVFPERGGEAGAVALSARNLTSEAEALTVDELDVRRGEILGIAGLDGSGRHALAQALAQVGELDSGTITVEGLSAKEARRAIGYVPQDRHREAVFPEFAIAESLTISSLWNFTRGRFLDARREAKFADRTRIRLGVKAPSIRTRVTALSGGNQQKVVMGRALARDPKVLVCEEPTAGVDMGARREIYDLLQEAASSGLALVVASTDSLELLGLCDRIAIMRDGRLHSIEDVDGLDEASLASLVIPDTPAALVDNTTS